MSESRPLALTAHQESPRELQKMLTPDPIPGEAKRVAKAENHSPKAMERRVKHDTRKFTYNSPKDEKGERTV